MTEEKKKVVLVTGCGSIGHKSAIFQLMLQEAMRLEQIEVVHIGSEIQGENFDKMIFDEVTCPGHEDYIKEMLKEPRRSAMMCSPVEREPKETARSRRNHNIHANNEFISKKMKHY